MWGKKSQNLTGNIPIPRHDRHLGMGMEPGSNGLGGAVLKQRHRAAPVQIHHDRAIGVALAFGPIVNADHVWRWSLRGLVVANTAQHGLAAARQTLAGELAGARRPTQHQAGVTLGLARAGGGVGIRAGHRRHPLGEGLPRTRGGVAK